MEQVDITMLAELYGITIEELKLIIYQTPDSYE